MMDVALAPKHQVQWNTKETRAWAAMDALRTCFIRMLLGVLLLGTYTHAAPTSTHIPGEGPENLVTPQQLRTGFNYLIKYGFLPKPSPVAGRLRSQAEFSEGIQAFQEFYQLPVTGIFDSRTAALMELPRCGLPDIMREDEDEDRGRRRRYVHTGAKWEKQDITYRIMQYSPDLTESETDDAVASALKLWGDVIPLNFQRRDIGRADIEISFARGLHRDDYPFDGPGGTLAHAFFPGDELGGDAHFDDDEHFTVKSYDGTNLLIVAAHEFGHSLGMGHSSDLTSLMAAFYQGYKPNYVLPYDDHLGIQNLYGARPGSVPSRGENPAGAAPGPPGPDPTSDPGQDPSCGGSYNAIAKIRGELMLFKGKTFWRMRKKGYPLEGYPIDTSRFWDQLPIKVDATYERIDSKILFFKDASYWEYSGTNRDPSFPRPIRELGLPDDIDAALPWGETGKTYFFKGEDYWRYDELERQVDIGYPQKVKEKWDADVPTYMDTAFRFVDEIGTWYTYFVRNKKYWRFDESRGKIDKGFPRSFDEDWMGCPETANLVEDSTEVGVTYVEPPKLDKMTGPGSDSVRSVGCRVHFSLLVLLSWTLTG